MCFKAEVLFRNKMHAFLSFPPNDQITPETTAGLSPVQRSRWRACVFIDTFFPAFSGS